MNNKLLFGVVVLIVVIVGAMLIGGKKTNTTTEVSQPTRQAQQEVKPITSDRIATVILSSSGFKPQNITIKSGTKVLWTNKSGGVATVNSAIHPTHLVYPPLNLGQFEEGKIVELVFDKPGTYNYHDHLNPSRIGTVVVN